MSEQDCSSVGREKLPDQEEQEHYHDLHPIQSWMPKMPDLPHP